jgi:protein-S-isoprenylcysteine O-methyltransferase Ste14
MDRKLKSKAFAGLVIVSLIMGAVLFVSAWTLDYWQGWVFLAVYFAASASITIYLLKNDPALLERRMKGGPTAEKRLPQRIIMLVLTIAFVALFVVSGLDHRFGWSHLAVLGALTGDGLVALSFFVYHLVFRENSFASATIEIAQDHKVIATGLYGLVRHPMYSGGMIFLLGIPLALGSLWAVLISLTLLPFLIWRITDEEKLLAKELSGYNEYCAKVKYRLIPWLY